MSDSDPDWLLDRARTARDEAARMRERARTLLGDSERAGLIQFAVTLEDRAKELERRARTAPDR